jgi:uncharacterized alpha-E superfamily protein
MPRSLSFCAKKIADNLRYLPSDNGDDQESGKMAKSLYADLHQRSIEEIFEHGLHEFIEDFIARTSALALQVERDYRFQG